MRFRVQGVDHVALTVGDLERSHAWYRDVLGLRREHAEAWGDVPVALTAGDSGVALFGGGSPGTRSLGLRHVAFRVDRENFELAQEELAGHRIPFERQDHGVSHSLYFRDPDGVELELTTYEL